MTRAIGQFDTKDGAAGANPKRALQAPFYAVKVTGALFHTQGGLDIDTHCRVLREDGSALPNLLAAGGAARGVSGNAVWGYLSGNGLLSAVAGGRIAAQTAVTQCRP
jgi:fumarate reductase flavoprotein subunit